MTIKDNQLKVTIVQPDLAWENKSANLAKIAGLIENTGQTDVIVMPEMFTTGFSMQVQELAETMEGPTIHWMKEKAAEKQAVVAGSLIIREEDIFFNRFVWVTPDGNTVWYDKRHLFAMGEENLHYTPGDRRVTVEWKGWKIRLLICYDLRFPVWSRNHDDYDLLVYTANWPAARSHVWKSLLVTRALENQCYCAGVNRTGRDGSGIRYKGDSGLVDARGEAQWLGGEENMKSFLLSMEQLHAFRDKFPLLRDRDPFVLPLDSANG